MFVLLVVLYYLSKTGYAYPYTHMIRNSKDELRGHWFPLFVLQFNMITGFLPV